MPSMHKSRGVCSSPAIWIKGGGVEKNCDMPFGGGYFCLETPGGHVVRFGPFLIPPEKM